MVPAVAWGGIRKMDGGTVDVNRYTRVLDARPLTVAFGSASYEVSLGTGALPSSFTLEEKGDRSGLGERRDDPAAESAGGDDSGDGDGLGRRGG